MLAAAPFQLSQAQSLLLHDNAQKELFPSTQAYYLALFGAPYSTITSNAVGTDPEKLLADTYTDEGTLYTIDDVLSLTTLGNSSGEMNEFLPQYDGIPDNGEDFLQVANTVYDDFLDVSASHTTRVLVSQRTRLQKYPFNFKPRTIQRPPLP